MISADAAFVAAEQSTLSSVRYRIVLDDTVEINWNDVIRTGDLTVGRAFDFDDIPSGDFTFELSNESGKYSPGRTDFILGERWWYLLSAKVYLEYLPITKAKWLSVLVFQGVITSWKNKRTKGPESRSSSAQVVQVTLNSLIYLLGQKIIGRTESDGTPNPQIYGRVIQPAVDLQDQYQWTPDSSAGAETGDTSEFDRTSTSGTGAITASTTEKYTGSNSFKCDCPATNDTAAGEIDLSGSSITEAMISFRIMFKEFELPGGSTNPAIVQLVDSGSGVQGYLAVDTDGDLFMYLGGNLGNIGYNINDIVDEWLHISVGVVLQSPGLVHVYVNNNRVISNYANFANSFAKFRIGLVQVPTCATTGWLVYIDDIKVEEAWYPEGYYLPGYPFSSINGVYRDGYIIPQKIPRYWIYRDNRFWYGNPWVRKWSANGVNSTLYDSDATYGAIHFNDYSDLPSGSFFIEATKNATIHPADIFSALLADLGLSAYINSASFTAAEAAASGDSVGCYFQDASALDAAAAIMRLCLYFFWDEAGEFKMEAYTGARDFGPVEEFTDWVSIEEDYDHANIRSQVTAKYGWYQKDKTDFYQLQDATALAKIGVMDEELNYEWGQEVCSDNAAMVQSKVALFLIRAKKAKHVVNIVQPLRHARISVGDTIRIDNPLMWAEPFTGKVFEKSISLDDRVVRLQVIRHLGEL